MGTTNNSIKIIFFGDISGKIARTALATIIPEWQKKYQPDVGWLMLRIWPTAKA
jgi:hypothetical protein